MTHPSPTHDFVQMSHFSNKAPWWHNLKTEPLSTHNISSRIFPRNICHILRAYCHFSLFSVCVIELQHDSACSLLKFKPRTGFVAYQMSGRYLLRQIISEKRLTFYPESLVEKDRFSRPHRFSVSLIIEAQMTWQASQVIPYKPQQEAIQIPATLGQ